MAKLGKRTASRVTVTCPCGTEFTVTKKRYEAGRGRRCSKACQYRFMERPSGLKYNVSKENPTSFRPGNVPWNKGRKLPPPWNKGQKTGVIPPNAFKPGETAGEANRKWLGGNVGYGALHAWVDRNKVKTGVCAKCGKEGTTEWSNVSHEYRRDLEDFRELCHQCNLTYDRQSGGWGAGKAIFPGYGARKG